MAYLVVVLYKLRLAVCWEVLILTPVCQRILALLATRLVLTAAVTKHTMLTTLFAILIIVAVAYACFWVIDAAFPPPITVIAKIIVGVIALIAILPLFGVSVPYIR